MDKHAFEWEEQVSGLSTIIQPFFDTTGALVVSRIATASGLDTGGAATAAKTHTATLTLDRFVENTLYLNISAHAPGAGTMAGATTSSIQVNVYNRVTSTVGWSLIASNTGFGTGNHAIRLVGTGAAATGITHFSNVKLEIVNSSNSGTAVMVGYVLSRTP